MTMRTPGQTPRAGLFRRFVPRPDATVRLYCFPHAGGTARAYHGWAKQLPEWVEVVAVQYPGRQDRYDERMPDSLYGLAEDVVRSLQMPFDRPTAFFGHSMGATVAYEVARLLKPRFPSPLAALFVSASKAPGEHVHDGVNLLDEGEFRTMLTELGGEGARMIQQNEELWQLTFPVFRMDMVLADDYRHKPGAPLTCPIVAIGGADDAAAGPEDLARWREYSVAGSETHILPGDHFYLEESLPHLSALLSERLGKLTREPTLGQAASSGEMGAPIQATP